MSTHRASDTTVEGPDGVARDGIGDAVFNAKNITAREASLNLDIADIGE
jgi:hypothetical protein